MSCLKFCPECHSRLKFDFQEKYQYCSTCGYWTQKETARLDSIIIFE